MNKIIAIIFGISMFIISLSVAYYFIYFLPKVNAEKLEQDNLKMQQQQAEHKQKQEQDKREYIARRKSECYAIYEKERDKWNNVEGHGYHQVDDVCIVRYNTDKYKGVDCDKEYKDSPLILECKLGIFTTRF
jgi:hypothetical protein